MENKVTRPIIRLIIIEDNATLVAAGFRSFFRPERDQIQVVKTFPGAEQAVALANAADFDVVVLDLMIPGKSPSENITMVRRAFPGKPVVIYTSVDSDTWRNTMQQLGAHGYVHKNDSREILKRALIDAFNGKVTLRLNNPYPSTGFSPSPDVTEPVLTIVEKEIVKMLARGDRYKQIAATLHLGEVAVETAIRQIRKKFDVASTAQLIHILTLRGLL